MAATPAPEQPIDRVVLKANSYDFGAMHDAAQHAETLKTSDKRREAYASMAREQALNQDVIAGREGVAIPEGTALVQTTDAQGKEVIAAVTFADPKQLSKALDAMKNLDETAIPAPSPAPTPATPAKGSTAE